MKKYLFLTSAFVAGGLLSGVAEAACIQTPSCSSLGYTSTSSCTGGVKCPFGNAWNCDSVNKITELTNKITELETKVTTVENNSTAGPRCADCKVGDYVCAGQCFSPEKAYYHDATSAQISSVEGERWLNNLCTGFVIEKSNGECRQIPTMYAYEPVKTISNDEFEKDPNTIITKDADGNISKITNQRIQNDCTSIRKIENEYYWPVIDSCVYSLERNYTIATYYVIEVSNDHYDGIFSTKSYRDRSYNYHYPTDSSFIVEKALQDLFLDNRLKVLNATTFK